MFIFDAIVAVAPVLGYVSQLQIIRKQQSIGSFSIDVTAIILISSTLRIFFWFSKGFAVNLLFQSIFLIIVMLILLHECVKLSPKPSANSQSKQTQQHEAFWRWSSFDSYIKFLLGLSAALTITTIIFVSLNYKTYGDVIGFLSLSIESTLGFPQMISNHKRKSVEGLSLNMIATWVIGDAFKTTYFVLEFIMCGTIQLIVDFIVCWQIYQYKYSSQSKANQRGRSSQSFVRLPQNDKDGELQQQKADNDKSNSGNRGQK